MSHVTVRTVRAVFATYVEVAEMTGFDIAGWTLQEGSAWQAYRLYVSEGPHDHMAPHPMADYIGATAKEAYTWLKASIDTMLAILELMRKTGK